MQWDPLCAADGPRCDPRAHGVLSHVSLNPSSTYFCQSPVQLSETNTLLPGLRWS
jgi:hypothetical protein